MEGLLLPSATLVDALVLVVGEHDEVELVRLRWSNGVLFDSSVTSRTNAIGYLEFMYCNIRKKISYLSTGKDHSV